jgi:hypothetical protein
METSRVTGSPLVPVFHCHLGSPYSTANDGTRSVILWRPRRLPNSAAWLERCRRIIPSSSDASCSLLMRRSVAPFMHDPAPRPCRHISGATSSKWREAPSCLTRVLVPSPCCLALARGKARDRLLQVGSQTLCPRPSNLRHDSRAARREGEAGYHGSVLFPPLFDPAPSLCRVESASSLIL